MSNELKERLNRIKYITGKTIEQVAADIGYSRVYLNAEANKGENKEILERLVQYEEKLLSKTQISPELGEEILNRLKNIEFNLSDTKSNVLYNQAAARATLTYLASLEAEKHDDSDEKFLNIVKAQNKSIDDILMAIHRARKNEKNQSTPVHQ